MTLSLFVVVCVRMAVLNGVGGAVLLSVLVILVAVLVVAVVVVSLLSLNDGHGVGGVTEVMVFDLLTHSYAAATGSSRGLSPAPTTLSCSGASATSTPPWTC